GEHPRADPAARGPPPAGRAHRRRVPGQEAAAAGPDVGRSRRGASGASRGGAAVGGAEGAAARGDLGQVTRAPFEGVTFQLWWVCWWGRGVPCSAREVGRASGRGRG